MNNSPQTHPEHAATALDHASRLSVSRPDARDQVTWSAQAAHVGDMAVLALALSNR